MWRRIRRRRACGAKLVIDRDTAARLGITTAAIDQTLYDAYGQRQVSTMFTQLNQYHVVMELKPGFQASPTSLNDMFVQTVAPASTGAAVSTQNADAAEGVHACGGDFGADHD